MPKILPIRLAVIAWFFVLLLPAYAETTPAESDVSFSRDIRPILSENCYFCHGPDANHRKAGLRMDDRDEAVDFAAIVPGDVEASELVVRIDHQDAKWLMPPPETNKKLTAKQKQLLKDWIAQGAKYEDHWSFERIERPDVPDLSRIDETIDPSQVHPVDAFVRSRLMAMGSDLSPPSRPDRLLRRLHLDLVGLPPTWEETASFFDEIQSRPQSGTGRQTRIENEIQRLLESPHHGERMAAFWLDIVRFADTVGYHGDQNQHIFPYRDWVIQAFQSNMPFDEFTVKQLAGDLVPNPTTDDLVATGFNRLNMMTREGGAQPGEYLTKYTTDRVRTVGMAWMGLTTGCAECHDHKFDPFTAKDFYSLGAFFADIQQWGVYSDYGYTPNPDLRGYNNDFPFPPEIELTSDALLRDQADAKRELVRLAKADLAAMTDEQRSAAQAWYDTLTTWLQTNPSGWQSLSAKESLSDDGKLRTFTVANLDPTSPTQSIRVSLATIAKQGPQTVEAKFFVEDDAGKDGKPVRRSIAIRQASANRWLPTFSSTVLQQNVASRWQVPATDAANVATKQRPHQFMVDRATHDDDSMMAVFELSEPLAMKPSENLVVEIKGLADHNDVQFAKSPLVRLRPFDATEIESLRASDSVDDSEVVLSWMLSHRQQSRDASAVDRWRASYASCRDGRTWTMVTQTAEPMPMRILPRGNWQDESGEEVMPATPEFLGTFDEPKKSQKRLSRLDLANWIVHRDNPLTARVVVNRLWKQFFGNGLTTAVDDLGAQGDPPSHPELLDYLAIELIDSGWDMRHVVKLILTSQTYQQDSRVRPELNEVDPENRLLAFHPPRRLEAEIIRDNALAISGLLNPAVGGPSVKPYQPGGYYSNLQFPNRDYRATSGDSQYRRGLYMHWQRTFLHPMLANFDAPSREDCVAIRANANTPQQALTLLNDPTFIEAAGEFAWSLLNDEATREASDENRLRTMIRRCVQREATSDEIARLATFLDEQRELFANDETLVDELAGIGQASSRRDTEAFASLRTEWAAWTATARIVLNLHETITRY